MKRGTPEHPKRPCGWRSIYFLRAGADGPIKIGSALCPPARMAQLQTGCPQRLELIFHALAQPGMESLLHRRFAPVRVHGEWYQADPSLLAYIDQLRTFVREHR